MKVVAKVHILYNSVTYKPGEELPNNNPEMVKAWIEAGTAEVVEDPKDSEAGDQDGDLPDPEDGIPEDDVPELYTEKQLDKLSSKSAIVEYAESIGLSGLDVNLHRPELIDKVLAYIEEVQKSDDV
ncbi:MAG: hypothetical protein NC293_09800 [Roseburia sp.]|nr:hypothetical protein [Roseburia sp.]